jgi:YebC/PmpR family DNA-binding regulatory protein
LWGRARLRTDLMAGHSHSANIKHRKNAVDAKRSKIFSKLARNIISATRQGGAELDTNLKLKYAVEKAKAANMPKDNIERAIKRGSGDKDGNFEELLYEGYAPGGVAMMIACLTDNKFRTAPEVKYTLEHGGGNLGASGSVSFMFDFRSIFVVEVGERSEDDLMELALEAGAEDLEVEDELATIFGAATDFLPIKEALEGASLTVVSAETGHVPQNTVQVPSKEDARKLLKLIDNLEDNDDVQNVYSNYEMPDEWFEELTG